jgi:hypothetical protein
VTESISGDHDANRLVAPGWNLNQHWGVTVDVREAQRTERLLDSAQGDQASVGAYYQFTPSLRVGGAVNVEAPRQDLLSGPRETQPRADVRVESAFRF